MDPMRQPSRGLAPLRPVGSITVRFFVSGRLKTFNFFAVVLFVLILPRVSTRTADNQLLTHYSVGIEVWLQCVGFENAFAVTVLDVIRIAV